MTFEVKILGCNSASFAFGRHHTSQLVNSNQNLFLVDCGEATQLQLIRYQVRYNRIQHIFISHLHGDHYLGLMGLIFTFHLQGRKDDLHIYGPAGLDEIIIVQLKHSQSVLNYHLEFHCIEESGQLLFENEDIQVLSLAMNHRIPCFGFVFQEKLRKHRLIRDILPKTLTQDNLADLKEGKDIVDTEGRFFANHELALPPKEPRKYVYLSDTRYLTGQILMVEKANLLYHEATFLNDMHSRAVATFHSTAGEAGQFAADHQVRQLVIGHYSSRYFETSPFLAEARAHFSETYLAVEGQTIEVSPIYLLTKETTQHVENLRSIG